MNRKFVVTVVVALAAFSVVLAEEFTGRITKVGSDGKTITVQKGKGKFDKDTKKFTFEKEGDPKEYTVSADAKVMQKAGGGKGKKKKAEPTAIENGLKNDMFSKIEGDGLAATITTDDSGKVTAITVGGGGGKKKKAGG